MIYLFKNIRIGYSFSICLLSIIYVILSGTLNVNLTVLFTLLITYLLEMFLVAFIFSVIAIKKHDKIISVLNTECDPIKYLNMYYPLTKSYTNKRTKQLVLLNLASGYIAVGDYQQARNVLASIDLTKCKPAEKIVFHSHITIINIYEGNFAEAEKALDYVTMLIGTSKIPSIHIEILNKARNLYAASIKIENGYFDEVEQTLLGIIATSENLYQKLSAKYTLAKLYIKQNRLNEAINEMTFVAENGNTLAIAQKAREFLSTLK